MLRVDPQTGAVTARFESGYDPAMVVSPDGKHLFLSSASGTEDPSSSLLSVVDTATKEPLASVEIPDRWLNTLPAYFPIMSLSPEGRWLYVLQGRVTGPNLVETSVATFDTLTNQALPGPTPLDGCGTALLFSGFADRHVMALCHLAHDARSISGTDAGTAAISAEVELPRVGEEGEDENRNSMDLQQVAGGGRLPDGRKLVAVTQNGYVIAVDLGSGTASSTEVGLSEGDAVPFGQVGTSNDGRRLFLGIRSTSTLDRLSGDRILVLDTASWRPLATLVSPVPFRSFALSPDGQRVYAVSTVTRSIVLFDSDQSVPIMVIPNIGESPTLAQVVNPS